MTADQRLFLSLGGRNGISAIVDGLYDRLESDPELARLFKRRDGERARLKEFREYALGGEARGVRGVGMQRRHAHRHITAAESARWLEHFSAAMRAAGSTDQSRAAVMELLRAPAERLVNNGSPRDVLKKARLLVTGAYSGAANATDTRVAAVRVVHAAPHGSGLRPARRTTWPARGRQAGITHNGLYAINRGNRPLIRVGC